MRHKVSVIIVLTVLTAWMVSYFIFLPSSESSENRTMATFRMVLSSETDSIAYRNTAVERLEAALSDQFMLRNIFVRIYLRFFNLSDNIIHGMAWNFCDHTNDQVFLREIGDYVLIGDTEYITAFPETDLMDKDLVDKHIEQIGILHDSFPNLKFYVYYVTQAYDTPWFNDYLGTNSADHFRELSDALPKYVTLDCLKYQDLPDYMNIHYKTDHHWNHVGARRGYEDIFVMMEKDFELEEMRIPIEEYNASKIYHFGYLGSYGRSLGSLYLSRLDEFSFYQYFDNPKNVSVIDPYSLQEIKVDKLGLYDEYQRGNIDTTIGIDHYITMYGTAKDIENNCYDDSKYAFVIRNNDDSDINLLICGDSYNRAFRDVLASHFDTTVYLDYRLLDRIPIDYIIDRYEIDAMLISSNTSMWNSPDYYFVFRGDEQ